jgi:hypothetical protein
MTSYSSKINGDKVHINELRTEDIHSTGTIYWDNFEPPLSAVGVSGLAAVLDTSDDADGHDINNLATLNATAVAATGIQGTIVNATVGNITTAQCKDVDLNTGGGGNTSTLSFSGTNPAQDTFITGDPTWKTGCTHLDLSSTTNVFPVDIDPTAYSWGGYWDQTNTSSGGIYMQLDSDEQAGWRDFRQTDTSSPYAYTPASTPFYVITKSTSNLQHTRQIIKVRFFIQDYGYGRIYIALDKSTDGGTTRSQIGGSPRLVIPREVQGGISLANVKVIGFINYEVVVDDPDFATGSEMRIYPKIRTDDEPNGDGGRCVILIGGKPSDAYGIETRNSQVIVTGQPVPTKWTEKDGAS